MESAPPGLQQLSCAQQGLWFLDRLAPCGRAYAFHFTYDITGTLDVGALRRAIDYVVRRHDALRSRVTVVHGAPYSVIGPASAVSGTLMLAEEPEPSFDLVRGPLFRAALTQLADDHRLLHISVHHLVFDAESRKIFERELSDAYVSFIKNRCPSLPPLTTTYAQFAARHNAWLASGEADAGIAYWQRQLDGIPDVELAGDRPRPGTPSFRGSEFFFDIPEIIRQNVNLISSRLRTTSFVVLLAAYQILLSRYTDTVDLAVGAPFSGRTSIELEQIIGFFVNTIGLRADLRGDPSFAEFVDHMRRVVFAAIDHQDIPFERQVASLAPIRDPGRHPIFQNWFDFTDHRTGSGDTELTFPGATATLSRPAETTTRFDTELHIELEDSGLRGHLVYATDLFDEPRMRRLSEHYLSLLHVVTRNPRRRLSAFGLLSAQEERHLLRLASPPWPRAGSEKPPTVTAWLDQNVAVHPDRIAVTDGREALTYLELRRRAEAVARWLQAQGAGPERVVGVCADRGAGLVVALLGVIRSGAAYLPIDPALPSARIGSMLADTGSAQVLASAVTRDAVPAGRWRVTSLEDIPATTQETACAAATRPGAGNALYVIYTSGSTGEPKGVVVTHRSFCNLVRWHLSVYGGEAGGEVISATANVAFDAAAWEIWAALLGGATLDLVPSSSAAAPAALAAHLRSAGTTAMFAATPLAEQLIREPLDRQSKLRRLLTGGDALRPRSADAPGVPVVNHYGPTEATVVATAGYAIGPPWDDLSIGRPIAGVSAYLLDRYLHLVPAGVTGELFVGGEGVSRGYVNRPAMTAERFLPDPWSARAGARMYRTGDLARWTRDGALEFLGRTDRQIKIRGLRIEPGEIESALLNCRGVSAAAVIAADWLGARRLVAYVTTGPEVTDPAALRDALRSAMRDALPDYMIPAAIVPVDSMPMNSNGKLDLAKLPEPSFSRLPYRPPHGPAQESMAALWSDVLGVPGIGSDDDFFELGGHSLSAARLAARIGEAFGVDLSVRAIFEHRRLGDLATAVEWRLRASIAAMPAQQVAAALSEPEPEPEP